MVFLCVFFFWIRRPPRSTLTYPLFAYTTVFRSLVVTAFKGPWRVTVEPLRDLTPDQGKAFQVWAVERNSGTTRPLLQVTGAEALRQSLGEDGWDLIKASEFLNDTLEDAGIGSATRRGRVCQNG